MNVASNEHTYNPTAILALEKINKRKEEMKTGGTGEDVPTPADANERLVWTYTKKVHLVSECKRDGGRD